MGLTPISGEIQAQPLNDNFSYLDQKFKDFFISVKDYGAKGDGVTDDTSAIQSAINAAETAGGGTIYFPPLATGLHYMASNISVPSNIKLEGTKGSRLKQISDTNSNFIVISGGATNVAISGLEIDGNKEGQSGIGGIGITSSSAGTSNVYIENCILSNCKIDGILVGTLANNWRIINNEAYDCGRFGIGVLNDVSDILVAGNYVTRSGKSGISLVGYGRDVTISNNKTYSTGEDGFAGYNELNEDLQVIGNTFTTCGNNGIHVGGTRLLVSGNIIDDALNYGISVWNNEGGSDLSGTDFSVIGNVITNVNLLHGIQIRKYTRGIVNSNKIRGIIEAGIGILIELSSEIVVLGNEVSNCFASGIRLVDSTDNNIIGNNITNTQDGIRLSDSGIGCINNTIVGNRSCANAGYGIITQNSSDYNIVTNNVVRNNPSGNISLVGTNNINANNIIA